MTPRSIIFACCLFATPALASNDFPPFWAEFSAAAKSGDEAKLRSLTKFPFLYADKQRGEGDFEAIWKGLFTPKVRACLGKAKPVKDKASYFAFCGDVIYIFEKTPAGWRFADTSVND